MTDLKDLTPAIVQDAETHQVLMLGYMSKESYEQTLETGEVTFFSRSRNKLWKKGETSGNSLLVVQVSWDCDHDAILIRARPQGPTCHRLTQSCFDSPEKTGTPPRSQWEFLGDLERIIQSRMDALPEGSYVSKLMQQGGDRIAQKVGEEAVETVIAAKNDNLDELEGEAADLLFHLTLLLRSRNSSLSRAIGVLKERHQLRSKLPV